MADRPLWERQPWDTPASWEKFHTYYLAQAPPRSLNEAYRRYRTEQGQIEASPDTPEAPGSWRRWYRAQDGHGQPIPGAAPWNERAQAWDDHLAAQDRQRWDARRRDVREQDWQAGDLQRQAAEVSPPVQRHEVGGAPDGEAIPISFIRVIATEADDDDADDPGAD